MNASARTIGGRLGIKQTRAIGRKIKHARPVSAIPGDARSEDAEASSGAAVLRQVARILVRDEDVAGALLNGDRSRSA